MRDIHLPVFFLLFTLFVIIGAFFSAIYYKPCGVSENYAQEDSWDKTFLDHPSKNPSELIEETQNELKKLHHMKSATIVDTSRGILDETEKSIQEIQSRLVNEAGKDIREEASKSIRQEAEKQLQVLREKRQELQQQINENANQTPRSQTFVMSENTLNREWTGYHGNSWGMLFTTNRDIRFGRARIDANKSGTIAFRVSEYRGKGASHGSTVAERRFNVRSGAQWIDLNLFVPGSQSKSYVIWYPKNDINSDVRLKRTRNDNTYSKSSLGPVQFKGGVSDNTYTFSNTRWYYLFQLEIDVVSSAQSFTPSRSPIKPSKPNVVGMRGGNGTKSGSDLPGGSVYYCARGSTDATFRVVMERDGVRSDPADRTLRIRSSVFAKPRVRVKFDNKKTGKVILQVKDHENNESSFRDIDEKELDDQQEVLFSCPGY